MGAAPSFRRQEFRSQKPEVRRVWAFLSF
ncbi:MAG: hypothetical protein ACOY31_13025 [Bacillota bacterium]